MPGVTLFADLGFGADRQGRAHLIAGFSDPEPGHCWATGKLSRFRVPIPEEGAAGLIVLHLEPFLHGSHATGFSASIVMDGAPAFEGRIADEMAIGLVCTALRPGKRYCTIEVTCHGAVTPGEAGMTAEHRPLTFLLKQAWIFACGEKPLWPATVAHGRIRPADLTQAGNVARLMGQEADALVTSFESVGLSCDFGLLQRELGAEPVGLLRFSGLKTVNLFRGLMSRFAGLGGAGTIAPYIVESLDEYWIHETVYGLRFHTFIRPALAAPAQLIARETHRLPFLTRKFMEDVENGEKIFVMRPPEAVAFGEVIAIWAALNVVAENTLLYLTEAEPGREGEVDALGPGLLRGHLTGILGDVAPSVPVWLSLCANARLAVPLP